jgi:hypothetical protein
LAAVDDLYKIAFTPIKTYPKKVMYEDGSKRIVLTPIKEAPPGHIIQQNINKLNMRFREGLKGDLRFYRTNPDPDIHTLNEEFKGLTPFQLKDMIREGMRVSKPAKEYLHEPPSKPLPASVTFAGKPPLSYRPSNPPPNPPSSPPSGATPNPSTNLPVKVPSPNTTPRSSGKLQGVFNSTKGFIGRNPRVAAGLAAGLGLAATGYGAYRMLGRPVDAEQQNSQINS